MKKKILRTLYYTLLFSLTIILSKNFVRQINLQKRVALPKSTFEATLKTTIPSSDVAKKSKPDRFDENFVFSKDDTKDPLGKPYTIIIWSNRRGGKTGYLANPEVCLANISCDITYDRGKLDVAHAVVFKKHTNVNDVALTENRLD